MHDTKWVQHALNTLGIDGTPLVEDGSYGRHTARVVREYQARQGLTVDGLAGPHTIAQLEKDTAHA